MQFTCFLYQKGKYNHCVISWMQEIECLVAWLWLLSINIWYTKLGRFSHKINSFKVLLIFEMEKFGPFLRKGGFTNLSYQQISALKVVLLIQYFWKEINFRKNKFSQSEMIWKIWIIMQDNWNRNLKNIK